jgi:hypothetical protein
MVQYDVDWRVMGHIVSHARPELTSLLSTCMHFGSELRGKCARGRGKMFSKIEGEMTDIFGLLGDVELCQWGKRRYCLCLLFVWV